MTHVFRAHSEKCEGCGKSAQEIMAIGPIGCPGPYIKPAADFHDTRPADKPSTVGGIIAGAMKMLNVDIKQGPVYIVGIDPATKPPTTAIGTRQFNYLSILPNKPVASAMALSAAYLRKHVSDAAWEGYRGVKAAGREQHEAEFRRVEIVMLTVAEHDALLQSQADLNRLLRTRSRDELERDNHRTQLDFMVRENARLRNENVRLNSMLADGDREREKPKANDGVTRIEPFPEVEPYDGDWIPPSHKPRMLP